MTSFFLGASRQDRWSVSIYGILPPMRLSKDDAITVSLFLFTLSYTAF